MSGCGGSTHGIRTGFTFCDFVESRGKFLPLHVSKNYYRFQCNGVLKRFEVFGVNDFTSERQIMSIVVKQGLLKFRWGYCSLSPFLTAGHSRPTLYCKGSDAVMLNLCSQASLKEVQLPRIHRHLRRLALQVCPNRS